MPQAAPGQPAPFPAPYGGINLRDGVAILQPFEARDMVNWEPVGSSVVPRPGRNVYSTAAGSTMPVETLCVWSSPSNSKLVGICDKVYDFSTVVAVLLYNFTYTKRRFQTENYGGSLCGVNGVDTPWRYNGTVYNIDAGFSGVGLTQAKLANVRMVHNRLWFCEQDSADAWYAAPAAITGVLTKFQLSQVVSDGYLVAIGAHSQEAGQGADDLTCFIMSTGKVVAYSGDPQTTFQKIGEYNLGALPVGRDCIHQLGGALHVITRMGIVPLSVAMQTSTMDFKALGDFGKVGPGLKNAGDLYRNNLGWCMRTWNGRLILNVPTLVGSTSVQWVMNTQIGAWTRWENFNAASMCEWNDDLYYGSWTVGTVRKVGGLNDEGLPIIVKVRTACVAFFEGMQAQITAVRFDMGVSGSFIGKFGIDDDFMTRVIRGADQVIAQSTPGTPFGSHWGSPWGASQVAKPLWLGVYGIGRALGISMEASVLCSSMEWYGSSVLVQQLGPGI